MLELNRYPRLRGYREGYAECASMAQAIKGVPKIEEGINPATWMLEVSTPGAEARTGADFAASYKDSEFARCGTGPNTHA